MRITFHGAAGTVTGSRTLVETGGHRFLVDCGLFQGYKQLRLRNWSPLPVPATSIDAVVLTHAHIDHSGYLPVLVREGFRGPIYCSEATADLCNILLRDSGHLQEADARFAERHGFSKHHPPKPLYTEADAVRVLPQLRPVAIGVDHRLPGDATFRFGAAGHILGACFAVLTGEGRRIGFSGDVGRPIDPLMHGPEARPDCDALVLESTYGDRLHDGHDVESTLAEVITRTVARGGVVLVPAFAVGRTQLLLLLLARLRRAGRIPDVPVVLDSPMAVSATELYRRHHGLHKLDERECAEVFDHVRYVTSPEDSKALDEAPRSMVLVSASGMATGGRVLHHLRRFAPEPTNTILFAGFQAGGTRGASIVEGAPEVKIHGSYVPIAAEVASLPALSAHADANELLAWLRSGAHPVRRVFLNHGEPAGADALRRRIAETLGWPCTVVEQGDRFEV